MVGLVGADNFGSENNGPCVTLLGPNILEYIGLVWANGEPKISETQ